MFETVSDRKVTELSSKDGAVPTHWRSAQRSPGSQGRDRDSPIWDDPALAPAFSGEPGSMASSSIDRRGEKLITLVANWSEIRAVVQS